MNYYVSELLWIIMYEFEKYAFEIEIESSMT